jgi:hypothetical protein
MQNFVLFPFGFAQGRRELRGEELVQVEVPPNSKLNTQN